MMLRRSRVLVATVATAAMLAACSTTNDTDDDSGEPKGDGASSSAANLPDDPDSGLAAANGDGPIQVGVPYTADGEVANNGAGVGAITRNDEAKAAKAVIDAINADGGVAGRQLEPVFFAYNATSTDTPTNQDQAACAAFTQDANIAVLLGSGITDTLDRCMLDAGVLELDSGSLIGPDDAYFEEFPQLYDAGGVSQDRMMADLVDTLDRLDWFSGWDAAKGAAADGDATVGVLTLDTPEWQRAVDGTLLPALDDAGYAVDDSLVFELPQASTQAELAQASTAVQNAVLKLVSSKVTHVIVLDSSGTSTLLFAQAAAQQKYSPRLGVNSASGAQALLDAGALTAAQLAGAAGLGWQPAIDLPAADGEEYATDAGQTCLDTVKAATGQDYTSTNAAGLTLSKCDMAYLMKAVIEGIDGDLGLASAAESVGSVGDSWEPSLITGSAFVDDRHDAVRTGYDLLFDDGCGCMTYDGEHEIP